MTTFRRAIRRFIQDEQGVTAIEYGVLAVLLVGAIAAGVSSLRGNLGTAFDNVGDQLSTPVDTTP